MHQQSEQITFWILWNHSKMSWNNSATTRYTFYIIGIELDWIRSGYIGSNNSAVSEVQFSWLTIDNWPITGQWNDKKWGAIIVITWWLYIGLKSVKQPQVRNPLTWLTWVTTWHFCASTSTPANQKNQNSQLQAVCVNVYTTKVSHHS